MSLTERTCTRPGWVVRAVLHCLCPASLRDAYTGDLLERYGAISRRWGRRRAQFWIWKQTLHTAVLTPLALRETAVRLAATARRIDMSQLLKDFRTAARSWVRTPALAVVAVLTISLGVGTTTMVFSVVEGVLLAPLGFPEQDRLVTVWGYVDQSRQAPLSTPDYHDLRQDFVTFDQVAARWTNTGSLLDDTGGAIQVDVGWVTDNYFQVLGIDPLHGRSFDPGDSGGLILSHDLWRSRYGADPSIVGRSVRLNDDSFTVVGVLPGHLDANLPDVGGTRETVSVWRTMPAGFFTGTNRGLGWMRVVARLAPGAGLQEVQAELDAFAALRHPNPDPAGPQRISFVARPVLEDLVGDLQYILWTLLATVCGVLLIACLNVSHLLLVRGHTRRSEVAIRRALGGSGFRIWRQQLLESLWVAAVGGAAGLGLAAFGIRLLTTLESARLPRLEQIALNTPVLLFGLGVTLAACLIFGSFASLRAGRLDVVTHLRATRGCATGRSRLGQCLIGSEIAMSVMLLTGAGLLGQSLSALYEVRPGFDTTSIVTFTVRGSDRITGVEEAEVFYRQLQDRLSTLPGVIAAGMTNRIPLGGGIFGGHYATETTSAVGAERPGASFRHISPGYFQAMGTRLLAGRDFEPGEGREVAIIDEKMARLAFAGQDPIGRRIQTGRLGNNDEWSRIIGVVEDMHHAGLAADTRQTIFYPSWTPNGDTETHFAVRAAVDDTLLLPSIRSALAELDPNATLSAVKSIERLVADSVAPTHFGLVSIGAFSSVALFLTAIGIYGVTSFVVGQRTSEIGIRLALGSGRSGIVRLIVRQNLIPTAAGLAAGSAGAWALGRLMSGLLFEVGPADPLALAAAIAVLAVVGLTAVLAPALRAVSVSPATALAAD